MKTYIATPMTNGQLFILCLLVTWSLVTSGGALAADVINVNYAGNVGVAMQGVWSYESAARGSADRTAPLTYPGNTWNDFNNAKAAGSNLLNSVGQPTAVGLRTTMEGGFWADWNGLGNARLLRSPAASSYADFTQAFELTGLDRSHTYDLYIASVHNNNNDPQDYRVGSVEKHVGNQGGITNWVEGRNHLCFAGLKPDDRGRLIVEGKGRQVLVNGFQLVDNEAPTPKSPDKNIFTFSFGELGPATISASAIALDVLWGTAVTRLAPTFTAAEGATVDPASGSVNDFTRPAPYTVTAQDGSIKVYHVSARRYSAWAHSASLYILTTPDGSDLPASATESNFPILVRLNTGSFDFAEAKPRGEDIRFSTAAGAKLSYQVEAWDADTGEASIWVKIPVITGNTHQEIRMYWGRVDATCESDGAGVFNESNGYASVLHMDGALKDEVGSITPKDEGAATVVGGIVGRARHFSGGRGISGGDHIRNYPYGDMPFTSELWFRAERAGATIFSWGRYATRYNGFTGDGNLVDIQLRSPAGLGWASDGPGGVSATTIPLMGQWYHVAATYSDGTSRIYVNGQLAGSNYHRAAMSMMNDIYMHLGHANFYGDIDEVRVSREARSADWMKLEYENQKARQTLVGALVQSGKRFSVSPASIKIDEGKKVAVTARAGGARKLYWITRRDGVDTISAVDQLKYELDAGRVEADASYTLLLKAVYADEVKTKTISVKVREAIQEPVFTLKAPSEWDGRDRIEVVPNITNLKALTAQGAGELHYAWTVSGGAVIKEVAPGRLILRRSQYTGPITVRAVINNGGADRMAMISINVTEPKSDPWVQRIPGPDEKPEDGQFFARNDKDEGTLYYNGSMSNSVDSFFLKIYADDELIRTETRKPADDKAYKFTVNLKPGLIKYRVEFGTKMGDAETVVQTVTNLVCGDAYLIQGQSNAVADNNGGPHGMYKSDWIRSFGNMGGATNSGWGNAVAASAGGDAYRIGYWGMALADRLVKAHKIPICMLNGAVGGTRIDQHQRNESDPEDQNTIYGRLLRRVKAARLTHGIRGVIWHQGENNSGAAAPTGDWDYRSYQQYFVDMSACWKQDYPSIRNYYVFQVWPLPCSMGPKGAQVREAQRTLPRLYSNMSVMSTIGITNHWGNARGLCHFDWDGYEQFATLMGPLLERDRYGLASSSAITAPDLKKAWYTSVDRAEIALEFGQSMAWDGAATVNFYLDQAKGQVVSGSADGSVVTLQLASPSTAGTINYLADNDWNGSPMNLLRGANGIAALTFWDVPILGGNR